MRINIRGVLFRLEGDKLSVTRRGAVNDPIGLAQSKHSLRLKRWLLLYKRKRQWRVISATIPPVIGVGMSVFIVWASRIRNDIAGYDLLWLILFLCLPCSVCVIIGYLIFRTARNMDREAIRILERHYGKKLSKG